MKKFIKYYFIITALLMPLLSKTQDYKDLEADSSRMNPMLMSYNLNNKDYTPEIILPTPHSQTFNQYINHEITEYHGLPQIEIPIGEISLKGLTIPIVLSYHASGIKYKQADGELGAGWSINIGGYRVSRTIHGKSDFVYTTRFNPSIFNGFTSTNNKSFEMEQYLIAMSRYTSYGLGEIGQGISFSSDGEYDMFSFNAPKTNGNFVLPSYTKGSKNKGHIFDSNNEDMSVYDSSSMTMRDNDGNIFSFGKKGNKNYLETMFQGQRIHAVGWPLVDIETPLGDKLNFSYKMYQQYTTRIKGEESSLTITNAETEMILGSCHTTDAYRSFSSFGNYNEPQFYSVYYVDKIEGENISIYFNRVDVDKEHKNTPCFIKSIIIKSSSGSVIKTVNFKYNSEAQKVEPHRLLKSVEISDGIRSEGIYNFEYYESMGNIPDQWGYYVARSNGKAGEIILHEEFGNSDIISSKRINQSALTKKLAELYPDGTYSLHNRAKNLKPQSFTLKKITYPTGGYTEYAYEPHVTNKYSGGGIRVKTIKSTTSPGDIPLVTHYEYSNGIPSFDIDYTNFRNSKLLFSWYTEPAVCIPGPLLIVNKSVSYTESVTYSMFPLDDLPMHDFSITYGQVTKIDENDTDYLLSDSNNPSKYEFSKGSVISSGNSDYLGKNNAILVGLTNTAHHWDMYQGITNLTPGEYYTVSIYVKLATATNFVLTVNNSTEWNSFTNAQSVVTGSGWQRAIVTVKASESRKFNIHLGANMYIGGVQQQAGNAYISYLQVEQGDGRRKGRTVSSYTIPERYKTDKMIIGYASQPREDISRNKIVVNEYALGLKPQLSERKIYDNLNILRSKEKIFYDKRKIHTQPQSIKGLKIYKKTAISHPGWASKAGILNPVKMYWMSFTDTKENPEYDVYNYIGSFFNYKEYSLSFGQLVPIEKITTYYQPEPIEIREIYRYDDNLRLISHIKSNSVREYIEKVYSYPSIGSTLEKANILTKPVKIQSSILKIDSIPHHNPGMFPGDPNAGIIYELRHSKRPIEFEETTYPTTSILPNSIKISSSTEDKTYTVLTYDKYDIRGNILQYTSVDGIPVSYIWSYNYQYPIAEFRNMTYLQAETLVIAHFGVSADALAKLKMPDENKIRTLKTDVQNVFITTYTYIPLVGISTVTDPRGVVTGYEYDASQRLKRTYVKEGSVERTLQVYEYNYVNK